MEEEKKNEILIELLKNECDIRIEFRARVSELNAYAEIVDNHVRDTRVFFNKHFGDKESVLVEMDDGCIYKVSRDEEPSKVEVTTYLPYGVEIELLSNKLIKTNTNIKLK